MTDHDDLYLTAARAYCRAKFPYGGDEPEKYYIEGAEGQRKHLEYDARSTARELWLRAVVDAVADATGRTPAEETTDV